eukprot:TRINITY_DN5031_c0_g1_i1.p1 TRINITY_DN5031_c0_g1~~TRINITY_DN5031_c0_g1_i1.p1  ORF type:complete len:1695 (-),score=309.88 TRINITY_DN5031_c0_g1_i1:43-5127(-)
MKARTAARPPDCRIAEACSCEIFSSANKDCSATSIYSIVNSLLQKEGTAPKPTIRAHEGGITSIRCVRDRAARSIKSGLCSAFSKFTRTGAKASMSNVDSESSVPRESISATSDNASSCSISSPDVKPTSNPLKRFDGARTDRTSSKPPNFRRIAWRPAVAASKPCAAKSSPSSELPARFRESSSVVSISVVGADVSVPHNRFERGDGEELADLAFFLTATDCGWLMDAPSSKGRSTRTGHKAQRAPVASHKNARSASSSPSPRSKRLCGTETSAPTTEMDTTDDDSRKRAGSSEDGEDFAAHGLDAATAGLQAILRKLGGFEDVLSVRAPSNRFKGLLVGLTSGDEMEQLEALSEVAEMLSLGTEDSLSTFDIDAFAPVLVNLLNAEHNPDLMLLAARSLTHLMDVIPPSCARIVGFGAVPSFCNKLLTIEYIDVAEQSLLALEKISHEHASAILQSGGLAAVLAFIDFFATPVQRVSASIAATMCKNVPLEAFGLVRDCIGGLLGLLNSSDQKVSESAFLGISRLVESFAADESKLRMIAENGVVDQLLQALAVPTLSPQCFVLAVHSLVQFVKASVQLTLSMIEADLLGLLVRLLQTTSTRSAEQLHEILCLIDEMLPTIRKGSLKGASQAELPPRERLLAEHSQFVSRLAENLLSVMVATYAGAVNTPVRQKCLAGITKIIHFSTAETLTEVLRHLPFSSFIASLLPSKDPAIVMMALQLCEALVAKLPAIFLLTFRREGVIAEIEKLCSGGQALSSPVTSPVVAVRSLVSPSTELRAALTIRARAFRDLFLQFTESEMDTSDTPLLRELQAVVEALNVPAERDRALSSLARVLLHEDGISTHEFISSGIVDALVRFISSPATFRSVSHMEVFGQWAVQQQVIVSLVKQLHAVIAQVEEFVTVLHDMTQQGSGMAMLTKPLRIKLQRADDSPQLKTFPASIVLIEPLATGKAIEEFLKPKVLPSSEDATAGSIADMLRRVAMRRRGEEDAKQHAAARQTDVLDNMDDDHWTTPDTTMHDSDHDDDGDDDNDADSDGLDEHAHSHDAAGAADDEDESASLLGTSQDIQDVRLGEDSKLPLGTPPSTVRNPRMAAAAAANSLASGSPLSTLARPPAAVRLMLSVDGEPLSSTTTILQVVQRLHIQQAETGTDDALGEGSARAMWGRVYTVQYCSGAAQPEISSTQPSVPISTFNLSTLGVDGLNVVPSVAPGSLISNAMQLVRLLEHVDRSFSSTPHDNVLFVNEKLNSKLRRQLQDPLVMCGGSLPEWCTKLPGHLRPLFSFDTRLQLFRLTAFGTARALQRFQLDQPVLSSEEVRPSMRIQRQKVRVSRGRVLESALKVMEMVAGNNASLEVEFYDEEGTGLGPTHEFYTLVSRELRRRDLHLWRDGGSEGEHVHAPFGMFPQPIGSSRSSYKRTLLYFRFMGRFVGKALQDNRLIDLPLSPAFFKLVLGETMIPKDVALLDATLYKSLQSLHDLAERARSGADPSCVDDLCLTFVLPGFPGVELLPGGADRPVTLANIAQYVQLVQQQTLVESVMPAVTAFREGFSEIVPVQTLSVFYAPELSTLMCGDDQPWTESMLQSSINCEHGYQANSPVVCFLIQVLCELDTIQRRQFLQFATGSPRLPVGGLAGLHPRLTVVRRPTDGPPDDFLPSVMTCTNYLKVPEYSSLERLRIRLLYAIAEGQASFHLS